jgi:hypothetical protein
MNSVVKRSYVPKFAFPVAFAAAFGSVSWLLIVIPGCAFGALVGDRRFGPVLGAIIVLPLLVLVPFVIRSCGLFINAAAVTPIQTSNATRLIQSIWGVIPQLFLGVAAPSIGLPLVIGWLSVRWCCSLLRSSLQHRCSRAMRRGVTARV